MENKKSKKEIIALLESRLEKSTGKKVVYVESKKQVKNTFIKQLKEAVEAGEFEKEELNEIGGLIKSGLQKLSGTTPVDDAKVMAYINSHPGRKKAYQGFDDEKKKAYITYLKTVPKAVNNDEVTSVKWDDTKKAFVNAIGGPNSRTTLA